MLTDLIGYCNHIILEALSCNEVYGTTYRGKINDKEFILQRKNDDVRITVYDDKFFDASCAVLQAKFRTLTTIKRNVNLNGRVRPYNFIQFCCQKESKIKKILGQIERVYFDLIKEDSNKKGI